MTLPSMPKQSLKLGIRGDPLPQSQIMFAGRCPAQPGLVDLVGLEQLARPSIRSTRRPRRLREAYGPSPVADYIVRRGTVSTHHAGALDNADVR